MIKEAYILSKNINYDDNLYSYQNALIYKFDRLRLLRNRNEPPSLIELNPGDELETLVDAWSKLKGVEGEYPDRIKDSLTVSREILENPEDQTDLGAKYSLLEAFVAIHDGDYQTASNSFEVAAIQFLYDEDLFSYAKTESRLALTLKKARFD